ncbi:hypothetical protein [Neobacillus endophyticus]|nr:hypothetical protein [Neobacillus endophyticus]
MEFFLEQCKHNDSEEPCEECAPNENGEEIMDIPDYDYNKRLWF